MSSNFVFRGQKNNLDATLDFLICCQEANDCFRNYLKNIVFCSQRMNGSLSTTVEFCISL